MDPALLLSGVLPLGMGAQWLAWYLKQPSILFLLLIGILIGPVLGYFQPALFGQQQHQAANLPQF